MSDPNVPPNPAPAPRSNRAGKLVLLAAIMVFGAYIWRNQMKGPALEGWDSNLVEAVKRAGEKHTKVVVVFVSEPLNSGDKKLIENALTTGRTKKALSGSGYLRVALNTKDNGTEANKYNVKSTPWCVLLNEYGIEEKRLDKQTNDLGFMEWAGIVGK